MSNMLWNILGIGTFIVFMIFSEMAWYLSIPIGIIVSLLVVVIVGSILGHLNK